MRCDRDQRLTMDPRRRLAKLPIRARRDLLRFLTSQSDVRADLIRQMHERNETRGLAELLMDLEADELIRLHVIDLLEQTT